MANDFHWQERPSHEYRLQRLEDERDRLERRLRWAIQRDDDTTIDKLSCRLDEIEAALDTDLRHWREKRGF